MRKGQSGATCLRRPEHVQILSARRMYGLVKDTIQVMNSFPWAYRGPSGWPTRSFSPISSHDLSPRWGLAIGPDQAPGVGRGLGRYRPRLNDGGRQAGRSLYTTRLFARLTDQTERYLRDQQAAQAAPRGLTEAEVERFMAQHPVTLPRLTLHGVRHCAASFMWDATGDLLAVSRALRHSSPAVTAKVYTEMEARQAAQSVRHHRRAAERGQLSYCESGCGSIEARSSSTSRP